MPPWGFRAPAGRWPARAKTPAQATETLTEVTKSLRKPTKRQVRAVGAPRTALTIWAREKNRAPVHGVESGGMGDASPAVEKSAGDVPPEIMIFQHLFSSHISKFCIFRHFQNKVAEIRKEIEFWGYVGLGAHESVPPKQNLVTTPLPLLLSEAPVTAKVIISDPSEYQGSSQLSGVPSTVRGPINCQGPYEYQGSSEHQGPSAYQEPSDYQGPSDDQETL